jgi:predicted RNase H-like nuclease
VRRATVGLRSFKVRKNFAGESLVGVDGCLGGWLAVIAIKRSLLRAQVFDSFVDLLDSLPKAAAIGVDIPIGLPDQGPRKCDLEVREHLGSSRMSSVFSAPLRACLGARDFKEAGRIRFRIEGKKMSLQAFGIMGKVREVDRALRSNRWLAKRVVEIHPEVSFAEWNGGHAMTYSKRIADGKSERAKLIAKKWPGAVESLRTELRGKKCALDDLHDAFAALWSIQRWMNETHKEFGDGALDMKGLPMRIVA